MTYMGKESKRVCTLCYTTETKATPKTSVTRTAMPSPKVAAIPTAFHVKIHFPEIKNVVLNCITNYCGQGNKVP